jgi:hypothetical protein
MVTALAMFRTSKRKGMGRRPNRPAFAAQPSRKTPKVKVFAAKTGAFSSN